VKRKRNLTALRGHCPLTCALSIISLEWVLVLLQDIFVSEFRQIGIALLVLDPFFGAGQQQESFLCLTDLWLAVIVQLSKMQLS